MEELSGWPDQVRTMQQNWIGRSEGLQFFFDVDGSDLPALEVYTTRPDTLMGVSYLAVAPEHPIASIAAEQNTDVAKFVDKCKQGKVAEAELAAMEKEGVATGLFCTASNQ